MGLDPSVVSPADIGTHPHYPATQDLAAMWSRQQSVYDPGQWVRESWEAQGAHRKVLVETLHTVGPFGSLLEVGCCAGPNLRRVHAEWPEVVCSGLDVNLEAITYGMDRAQEEGWYWQGYVGSLNSLEETPRPDVILSCYCLTYVDPRGIDDLLARLCGHAQKALVIAEPMAEGLDRERVQPHGKGIIGEYHHSYWDRLIRLQEQGRVDPERMHLGPVEPRVGHLQGILTVQL